MIFNVIFNKSNMQEKFRLSPWRIKHDGDDQFSFNCLKDKKNVMMDLISNKQSKRLAQTSKWTRISASIGKKQNTQRMDPCRAVLRSAQSSPSRGKKQPLKLGMITNNNKNLNLRPQKTTSSSQLTKDSHDILVQRLLKLRRDGKLQIKESNGQRILRF